MTLSKERLEEIAEFEVKTTESGLQYAPALISTVRSVEVVMMARELLERRERDKQDKQEPVAEVQISRGGYDRGEKVINYIPEEIQFLPVGAQLYAGPPAPIAQPVLVPDAISSQGETTASNDYYALGWNSCRAAMLSNEPVSNRDELPMDYQQGHKDGLEWAARLAESNHPQTGDWLYDDPIELAKAIRKGPDMPELKPVAADADDNFYSWFCREWEQNYQPNAYSLSAKKHLGAIAESAWFACRGAMIQGADGNSPVIPDGWMLVPVEPTAEMYDAGDRQLATKQVWDSMIAAAPQEPTK